MKSKVIVSLAAETTVEDDPSKVRVYEVISSNTLNELFSPVVGR